MVKIRKIAGSAGRSLEFSLNAGRGHTVALAGSFNDWDPALAPMMDSDGCGVYRCRVTVSPGSYEYKFVVDNEWLLDDDNPNFASNDFGTLNSVVVVD